ncbi:MAG TPA: 30S ribosomal protein S2 [Candidatus Gracilibacteria bacterium]
MAHDTKTLFENYLHIGHKADRWNPRMKTYLAGQADKVYVFDLEKTAEGLDKATAFLKALKIQNKKALFVGTKPQSSFVIHKLLKDAKHFYVDKKWTPGLLTNFKELRKRIDHYLNLKKQFETGEISKYTKKEVARFKKELEKLEIAYGGVAEMRAKPDVVIALDAVIDRIAIDEANCAGVSTMAIVDANANPLDIDYVIPANDDSFRSIEYIMQACLDALK